MPAKMQQRDVVVAGQRRIGAKRGGRRQNPVPGGYGGKALLELAERNPPQLVIEEPDGKDDGAEAYDTPDLVLQRPSFGVRLKCISNFAGRGKRSANKSVRLSRAERRPSAFSHSP